MKRFFFPMIFIACNSYAAGIQKWTDEGGNIHYGDTPPMKTESQTISISRPPSNPGKPLPRLNTEKKVDKSTNVKSKDKSKKSNQTTDELNKQVCEKAKENLQIIDSSSLIRLKLNDGTERVLTDEEVDERRLKLEQDVKQYCN